CLRDPEAALAVFSAQATAPEVPVDAKAFSYRLGQFIDAALDYEDKLLQKPSKPAPDTPSTSKPPKPETDAPSNSKPARPAEKERRARAWPPQAEGSVMTLDEFHRQTARSMAK